MAKYETNEQTLRRLEREERKEALLTKVELKAAKHLLETGQKNDEFIFEHRDRVNLIIAMIDRILKKADNGKLSMAGGREQFVYWTKLSSYPENLQGVARSCQILYGYADFYFTETHDHDVFKFSRNGVERLAIKYLKKVLESRHYDSLKIKYPTINELSGVSKYRPSHKALVNKLYKMIADDNILEDDGSNDDDFDEDEIVTVDDTDNDAEDDDDDDELVAIDTAKAKEEVKMMTISKAKLEAYEKATNAENKRVTAENSVNNNNNGADSDELLALKVRHTNLEIKRRKSGIKVGLERIRDKQEEILQYTGKILGAEDVISNLTALILNDKLILDELQTKAAALENEVVNRKLIDATDEIVTAGAVDASVAVMIELNAANFTAIFNDVENNFTTANLLNVANDFTTANLLAAVNTADKAVENVVTFEIQNFAADVNIADSYATIDTAVSGTVIPVIDDDAEDAEIKNQLAEIADLANREKELEQQIAALQEELNAVHREYVKKDWKLTKYAKDLMDAVYQTVKTSFEKRTEWGCIEINGVMMQSWHWDEHNAVRTKFDDSGFALWFYDDTVPREYQYTEFVKYSTFKQFKAAISELAEAIERGEKTFTFPADETADK